MLPEHNGKIISFANDGSFMDIIVLDNDILV